MTEIQAPYAAPPRPLDVDGLAGRNGVGWKTEAARYIQDLEARLAKLDGMTVAAAGRILWESRTHDSMVKYSDFQDYMEAEAAALLAALRTP